MFDVGAAAVILLFQFVLVVLVPALLFYDELDGQFFGLFSFVSRKIN